MQGWMRFSRAAGAAGTVNRGGIAGAIASLAFLMGAVGAAAQAPVDGSADPVALTEELRGAESAFARSMAERDAEAFASFLAEEAIFMGQRETLRGKAAVAAAWSRFFEGEAAPFSWAPERVEVLDSGTLGLTSGPVRDAEGTVIGTFNSIWRREGTVWRIVFDKGCPPCP